MKKYLAMLLAGALSVSLLAGCGGSNGSDSAASNAGSTSNGSADQSNVIKIGGIGPDRLWRRVRHRHQDGRSGRRG